MIGEKAKISANISAKSAKIGGSIAGNIKIKGYLEIDSSARINGEIQCEQISISKGAIINGRCSMEKQTDNNLNSDQSEK